MRTSDVEKLTSSQKPRAPPLGFLHLQYLHHFSDQVWLTWRPPESGQWDYRFTGFHRRRSCAVGRSKRPHPWPRQNDHGGFAPQIPAHLGCLGSEPGGKHWASGTRARATDPCCPTSPHSGSSAVVPVQRIGPRNRLVWAWRASCRLVTHHGRETGWVERAVRSSVFFTVSMACQFF